MPLRFLLGMVAAFTDAGNFSGMTLINTKLKLSDIVHKAFIEVENGLEVADGCTAVAQEGFNSRYSLWTQRPKVNFLL